MLHFIDETDITLVQGFVAKTLVPPFARRWHSKLVELFATEPKKDTQIPFRFSRLASFSTRHRLNKPDAPLSSLPHLKVNTIPGRINPFSSLLRFCLRDKSPYLLQILSVASVIPVGLGF
jgi:hypothetical protein